MAVADANYQFSYIEVGAYGSEGDSTIFRSCQFGSDLAKELLPLPPDSTIAGSQVPFFFIADDAFPLQRRILKPYSPSNGQQLSPSENIFNYRY